MKKTKIVSDVYLPDTKWKKGDVIKITNENNKKNRFIMISKVIFFGDTVHCVECGKTFTTIRDYRYEGVVQKNSFDDNIDCKPLRPGYKILFSKEVLHNSLFLHNFSEIVEEDNPLNIQQREKEWRSVASKISRE